MRGKGNWERAHFNCYLRGGERGDLQGHFGYELGEIFDDIFEKGLAELDDIFEEAMSLGPSPKQSRTPICMWCERPFTDTAYIETCVCHKWLFHVVCKRKHEEEYSGRGPRRPEFFDLAADDTKDVIEVPRARCQCHCGCRRSPGRRLNCDWCGQAVGVGCCLSHTDPMRNYCHWCRPLGQQVPAKDPGLSLARWPTEGETELLLIEIPAELSRMFPEGEDIGALIGLNVAPNKGLVDTGAQHAVIGKKNTRS